MNNERKRREKENKASGGKSKKKSWLVSQIVFLLWTSQGIRWKERREKKQFFLRKFILNIF